MIAEGSLTMKMPRRFRTRLEKTFKREATCTACRGKITEADHRYITMQPVVRDFLFQPGTAGKCTVTFLCKACGPKFWELVKTIRGEK